MTPPTTPPASNSELSFESFSKSLTPQRLLVLQMVVGALVVGVLMFLIVAFFIRQGDEQVLMPEGGELMVVVCACIAVSCLVAHVGLTRFGLSSSGEVLGSFSNGDSASLSPEDQLYIRIQTLTILRFAPLEGAAMVGIVFYLIGSGTINLVWLVPFFVLSFFAFPTRARVLSLFGRLAGVNEPATHGALQQ